MALENTTLGYSPELNIQIAKVSSITKGFGGYYEIRGTGPIAEGISIIPDRKKFAKKFKVGNEVLVIMRGSVCEALYGPIDRDKLYVQK